jgi:hypothetical protein
MLFEKILAQVLATGHIMHKLHLINNFVNCYDVTQGWNYSSCDIIKTSDYIITIIMIKNVPICYHRSGFLFILQIQ